MKEKKKTLDDATLRAYLDQALSEHEREQVEARLARSPEAQAALARLRQIMADTEQTLAILTPSSTARPSAAQALQRLHMQLADQSSLSVKLHRWQERIRIMLPKTFIQRYKPAVAALALLLLVAVAMSFAPVRAMAGDLLQIFRVQEVKLIPVDLERIENLENNQEFTSLMDQFSLEGETIVDGGEPQQVANLDEAAGLVSFKIAQLTVPADAGALDEIQVQKQSIHQATLDPDLVEAIFAAADIEVDLPDSLHDSPITITKPDMVMQGWGSQGEGDLQVGFMQMPSPEIEYPPELDLNELGVAALQLMGHSKAEAMAIGATINWANTLILPVPNDGDMEVTEVSVNGVKGTLFTNVPEDGPETALMWQQNGMTYMLVGKYSADQLLTVAESLH